ncbi:hypothetical protein [Hyphococcus sp.]|uniref:hypothetical protein n=1 Tax=Hyphococcus sp. TaxID=2038636 RepID=UPI002087D527|nr:MAG: hypothetical protein DHS20C04_04600 [Marinicaulis sp.]
MPEINTETLEAYVAAGGLAVTIVGFAFIIVQIRQIERSVRSGAQAAIYTQAADFRSHLVAYPELRPLFFDGADIDQTHPDFSRALTLAELFLNYLEQIAVQGGNFDGGDRRAWESFVRLTLAASPIMKRRLEENKSAYSVHLRKLA